MTMDARFLVCTACGADAASIPEERSGYPDNVLRVVATIGTSEGLLLVVPHLFSCWRLEEAARIARQYPPLATVTPPGRVTAPDPDTADIIAALSAADIDYRIQHPGTVEESILVTRSARADDATVAFGPATTETGQAAEGIDVAYYYNGLDGDVSAQDYILTVDELIASLRRFLA